MAIKVIINSWKQWIHLKTWIKHISFIAFIIIKIIDQLSWWIIKKCVPTNRNNGKIRKKIRKKWIIKREIYSLISLIEFLGNSWYYTFIRHFIFDVEYRISIDLTKSLESIGI